MNVAPDQGRSSSRTSALTTNGDAGQTDAAAEAQIARLRGDLDLKRLDLQRAQAEVARLEPLFTDGGITAQRMEGARSAVSAAQSQIASLNGQISPRRTAPAAAALRRRRPRDRRSKSPSAELARVTGPASGRRSR